RTDRGGRFLLAGLGEKRLAELRFEAGGIEAGRVYVATAWDFAPRAGWPPVYGPTFSHTVKPDQVIRGRVRDAATGKPLAGVKVVGTARTVNGLDRPDWSNTVEGTTDAAGRFLLAGLPRAPQRWLHAQALGNPHLDRIVQLKDEGIRPVFVEIGLRRCVV